MDTPCLAGPLPSDEVEQVANPLPPPQRCHTGLRVLDHTFRGRGGGLRVLEGRRLAGGVPVIPRDVVAVIYRDLGDLVLLPRGNPVFLELDRYEGIVCTSINIPL